MNQPYTAGQTELMNEEILSSYYPRMFALNGRIGRIYYFYFSSVLIFLATIFCVIFYSFLLGPLVARSSDALNWLAGFIACLPQIFVVLICARRRLHDLNKSGWLSLLMLVPILNIVMWLYLTFSAGTQGSNKYGPQAEEASKGILIVAIALSILLLNSYSTGLRQGYHTYRIGMQERAAAEGAKQLEGKGSASNVRPSASQKEVGF